MNRENKATKEQRTRKLFVNSCKDELLTIKTAKLEKIDIPIIYGVKICAFKVVRFI